jgi:Leucine-rich repeat (LRR) protein
MRAFLAFVIAGAASLSIFTITCAGGSEKTLRITRANAKLLDHIGEYPDLEVLSINCLEGLQSLPDSVGSLAKLKVLRIDNGNGCSMNPALPETIGNLHLLEKLILFGAQDPRPAGKERGPQPAERHTFPSSMSELKNLTYLDLGRNGLAEIPSFVKDLPKLRELDFEWNIEFRTIPAFITDLHDLETLKLAGNDLDDLPDSLTGLLKLKRITLGNNCQITQSNTKMADLKRRFPKISLDLEDEYDCPAN